jgi:uncharacterized protein (DUF1684 family)
MKTALAVAAAGALLFLPSSMRAHAAPQSPTDAAAVIKAAQTKIDTDYKQSKLSPFTAVGVRYLEAGQACRVGANGTSVVFDPPAGTPDIVDMAWDGKGFTLTPIAGTRPVLYDKAGPDDVDMRTPRPVTGAVRLKDTDAIALGRFFIESYARQGNVRLSDPDAESRKAFAGLKWFPPDLSLQVKATYEALNDPKPLVIMTSRGMQREYYRVGRLSFAVGGTPLRLTALSPTPTPKAGDELFIPFRDATTGAETYSVGRYLTLTFEKADGSYVVDFNLATNPLCNYSPHYNCPIPPRENFLTVAIRAGEMTFPKAH